MLFAFLGPISSATTKGVGPLFSWVFIIVATWVLAGVWAHYLKRRKNEEIPLLNVVWITAISVFILAMGIRGLLIKQ
jgi:hypothetical protein